MISCLVVDDEPLALQILEDYISKVPSLKLVKATFNPIEALDLVQQGGIDLVFLDVQMPELTGIQFLKITNGKAKVILTTAYPQYALDGYDLDVADYLLKPIAFHRFYKAVQKVTLILQQGSTGEGAMSQIIMDDFIFLKTESKIQKLYINDILYIEGLKDYVSIFTANERMITLQSMKRMEEALPVNYFVRVHKSYIVALNKIESIERSRIFINGKVIPVGETYKDAFFKMIDSKNI
jgi:two-component system LytT family response regulator